MGKEAPNIKNLRGQGSLGGGGLGGGVSAQIFYVYALSWSLSTNRAKEATAPFFEIKEGVFVGDGSFQTSSF